MSTLNLRYDACTYSKPRYLSKAAIEAVATEARAQLLPNGADALTLEQLAAISELCINGLSYQLWVSLEHAVTDEAGQAVLGLCEFDPGCAADAISVLVSPVGEQRSPELVLSTFAHELGHAIFDAPAWMMAAKQGPGLFEQACTSQRSAYRTATPDAEHLTAAPQAQRSALEKEIRIAEFRANEFMGALLVPRERLVELAVAHAAAFDVGIESDGGLFDELHGAAPRLIEQGRLGFAGMANLQRKLATTFGVSPKFMRVRMQRYGLLTQAGQG